MAVYSPITNAELKNFLNDYNLGQLEKFEGILEGIENTNYKITTTKNIYILTIFEKRVNNEDLPFFINLKKHLFKKKFPCPQPIANKKGDLINYLKDKSCVLISYLEGSKTNNVSNYHCEQVGQLLSSLHQHTADFKERRINSMNYDQWENIFKKCKSSKNSNLENIFFLIEKELIFIKKNWPNNIPIGIIHADVFQDNVFFVNDKFSGLIDFYFACNDYLAYDIALTINAWCFDKNNEFIKERFMSLIKGYEINRVLNIDEKNLLSVLLRGASLRILLTRLHDQIFHQEGAFVKPKDPQEYIKILNFHQKNNVIDYLL